MTNRVNLSLIEKLRNKDPLTDEDLKLILENEEFLDVLLTWLHWNENKKGFEIGYYDDGFIDKKETNDYISDYLEKRDIN